MVEFLVSYLKKKLKIFFLSRSAGLYVAGEYTEGVGDGEEKKGDSQRQYIFILN